MCIEKRLKDTYGSFMWFPRLFYGDRVVNVRGVVNIALFIHPIQPPLTSPPLLWSIHLCVYVFSERKFPSPLLSVSFRYSCWSSNALSYSSKLTSKCIQISFSVCTNNFVQVWNYTKITSHARKYNPLIAEWYNLNVNAVNLCGESFDESEN